MSQTIRCPKCKTEQIKQPICENCGFDIRGYALSRTKTQPDEITCPDCKARIPKQPTCPKCGFDIRAYALAAEGEDTPVRYVPCPNCFEQTPEHRACQYCGYDLRLIDQRELYRETATYTKEFVPPEEVTEAAPPLSLKELFSKSWARYKLRWKTLLGLYLLSILFTLIGLVVPIAASVLLVPRFHEYSNLILVFGGLLSVSLGLFGSFWGVSSMTAAVAFHDSKFKEALSLGRHLVFSYAWLAVLASLIIAGGLWLFVVPGVLLLVWAFSAQFIIFKEHDRGLGAMLRSRHYVKGHWGNTFVKLLAIFVVVAVLSFIPFGPLFTFPFMLSYLFEMYEDLRLIKVDERPEEQTFLVKSAWSTAGVVGLLLPLVFVLLIAGPAIKYTYQQVSSGEVELDRFIPPSLR